MTATPTGTTSHKGPAAEAPAPSVECDRPPNSKTTPTREARHRARSVPIDLGVERAALGAAILNRSAAEHVAGARLDDWTLAEHSAVAAAIRDLVAADTDPDPILIAHRADVDLELVRDLFVTTPAISSAGAYCTILARLGRLRRIIHAAGALSTAALDELDDDHLKDLLDNLAAEVCP